ncbi:hypothetical protein Droror1_Dr00014148 [Drosera rotundifolia]
MRSCAGRPCYVRPELRMQQEVCLCLQGGLRDLTPSPADSFTPEFPDHTQSPHTHTPSPVDSSTPESPDHDRGRIRVLFKDGEFYVEVTVGSRSKVVRLLIDTVGDLTWIRSSSQGYDPMETYTYKNGRFFYRIKESDVNEFDPHYFELEEPSLPIFPNLARLTVEIKSSRAISGLRVIRDLVSHSLQLEELVMENVSYWMPQKTWVSFSGLKVIRINGFDFNRSFRFQALEKVAIAMFILRNVEVLEQLILVDLWVWAKGPTKEVLGEPLVAIIRFKAPVRNIVTVIILHYGLRSSIS